MKGLKELENIGSFVELLQAHYGECSNDDEKDYQNSYKIIETELKVLEIIKSKLVGEFKLREHNGHYSISFYFDDGNDGTMSLDFFITKEEYDLLKEWLDNGTK